MKTNILTPELVNASGGYGVYHNLKPMEQTMDYKRGRLYSIFAEDHDRIDYLFKRATQVKKPVGLRLYIRSGLLRLLLGNLGHQRSTGQYVGFRVSHV